MAAPARLGVRRAAVGRSRHSMAVQRSITTDSPPRRDPGRVPVDDAELSHRQRALTATACSACGTHSSDRRKTSTMSTGPVAPTASARLPEGLDPQDLALVRVDRHAVEALVSR